MHSFTKNQCPANYAPPNDFCEWGGRDSIISPHGGSQPTVLLGNRSAPRIVRPRAVRASGAGGTRIISPYGGSQPTVLLGNRSTPRIVRPRAVRASGAGGTRIISPHGDSQPTVLLGNRSAPGGTRTLNLSVRSALLYPIELPEQSRVL